MLCILPIFETRAISLEVLWKNFHLAQDHYFRSSQETYFWDSWREKPSPQSFSPEVIAYRMHSFCHKYFENYTDQKSSYLRGKIENLIWKFYLPQVRALQYTKPVFFCKPGISPRSSTLSIRFQIDYSIGFFPNQWEYYSEGRLVKTEEALFNRMGKPDHYRFFDTEKENCILKEESDTNGSGNIDKWFIYQDCQLVRTMEDYNEDGKKERVCHYSGLSEEPNCLGIGEKNRKLAWKNKENPNQFIAYLKKTNRDYIEYFGEKPRHVCENYLHILKTEYDLKNFESIPKYNRLIQENPHCEKENLEAEIFSAYTDLYKLKNFASAAIKYKEANQSYTKKHGMESVDLVLNTAFAYYRNDEPDQCLGELKRIQHRTISDAGLFLYHYYTGSCHLKKNNHREAFKALKTSQAFSDSPEDISKTYLKLGILFSRIQDGKDESDNYFRDAIELYPENEKFVRDFKKRKTFLAE